MHSSINGRVTGDKHYRVVRFFTDFSAGIVEEVVVTGVDLKEAQEIAGQQRGTVPGEDVVIQDLNKRGLDAEVDDRDFIDTNQLPKI